MDLASLLLLAVVPVSIEFIVALLYLLVPSRPPNSPKHFNRHRIVQITTRDAPPELLRRTISEIRKYDQDVLIFVVTDNQNPVRVEGKNIKYLIVPPDYKNGKAKARALNYALEWKMQHFPLDRTYTLFIDEENLVSERLMEYLKHFHGLISVGPSLFHRSGSVLAWLMDGSRNASDAVFRLLASHGLPAWHGENVIMRLDVEAAVGWRSGLAEDLLTHLAIFERFGRIYSWHDYPVYSFSPMDLKDLFRQRRRWHLGLFEALFKSKHPLRFYFGYKVLVWLLVSLVILIGLLHPGLTIPAWAKVLALVGVAMYVYGWVRNGVPAPLVFVGAIVQPILFVVETLTLYYAIVAPTKQFEIIKKPGYAKI